MSILAAAALTVHYTYHHIMGKIPGNMVFRWDTILPIAYIDNLRYISQREKAQRDKYGICKKSTRTDHDYRVGDQILIRRKSEFKYKSSFQGPFKIVQTWTNGMVTLRVGAVSSRINTRYIKSYNTENTECHIILQSKQYICIYIYTYMVNQSTYLQKA